MVTTFEDFEPGRLLGRVEMSLDAPIMENWHRLFPDDELGGRMPHGMIAVVSMRAFFTAVPARPPGNIHAAQYFDVHRLPQASERLTTSILCVSKEVRRDRRRVTFATETLAGGHIAFSGRMTILWAC